MNLDKLGLQINSPFVHPGAKNFRPPSWPPPPDWSPILDANGTAQCVYSDSVWPLDVWERKSLMLNFGDGKTRGRRIDKPNADLLRQCAAWFMFGPRGCQSANTLAGKINSLKPIFMVCTAEGIVATDLMRFPKVLDRVAREIAPSNFDRVITYLHELLDANGDLGFCMLDTDGMVRLSSLAPDHDERQTPYIPPRIWSYQVSRLRECIAEYLENKEAVDACFTFCIGAYTANFGSLKHAVNAKGGDRRVPFHNADRSKSKGCTYYDTFKLTSDQFGVTKLIEKWVGPFSGEKGEHQLAKFSQYLDVVSKAGLAYILNFSLMRIDEGLNLRADCVELERDEKFGNICMLRGETTKTDPDDDARWPVSHSVELAVEVMKHIAGLRMRCAAERDAINLTTLDKECPFLVSFQFEPWSRGKSKSYGIRPTPVPYAQVVKTYPRLFDAKEIAITEEDLRIARLITPSLNSEIFKVGASWRFNWHQLRRTGAVNMLSSGLVDEPSLQFLLKHLSRVMTLYYGRNHSRLNLNQETRAIFLKTMYQEFGRELRNLQSPQFVSPLGQARKEDIVIFIKESDALNLDKAARQGKVGARRIRAGFCVKNRSCPYGGHEAIAHCLGGDDGKGCPDLLVDITKEPEIRVYENLVNDQLAIVDSQSPRHKRLQAEKRAICKYYEVIKSKNR